MAARPATRRGEPRGDRRAAGLGDGRFGAVGEAGGDARTGDRRGDTLLNGYGFREIVSLAGGQDDFWRQEFLRLAALADGLDDS